MGRRILDNLEEVLGCILLLAVCVVALIRVCSRYGYLLGDNAAAELIGAAGSWSVELSTYLFIWMTFVGASLALKKHEHFAVEVLVEKLPSAWGNRARVLSGVLVVAFALLLVWFGSVQVVHAWETVTPVMEIPRAVPYAAVPFGGLLMAWRAVEALLPSRAGTAGSQTTR